MKRYASSRVGLGRQLVVGCDDPRRCVVRLLAGTKNPPGRHGPSPTTLTLSVVFISPQTLIRFINHKFALQSVYIYTLLRRANWPIRPWPPPDML